MSSRPVSPSTGTQSISAPTRSASCCQGTMLEWCSISVRTIAVARADVGVAPGAGDQVDRLGRVANEDHLAPVGGAEVVGDRRPRSLVGRRRLGRERVRAAVDVGVVGALVAVDRLDRGQHPLGAGAAVQVGDRLAVHLPLEGGKGGADLLDRERGGGSLSSSAPCSRGQAVAPASTSSRIQP